MVTSDHEDTRERGIVHRTQQRVKPFCFNGRRPIIEGHYIEEDEERNEDDTQPRKNIKDETDGAEDTRDHRKELDVGLLTR